MDPDLRERTTVESTDARYGLLASRRMTEQIYVGNAEADAPENRGWLLGHFKPADDPRHSEDV